MFVLVRVFGTDSSWTVPQITCDSRSVSSSAAQTSERDLSGPEKDVHRLGEVLQQLSEHVKLMKASTVPPDGQAQSQGPELLQFITDANAGDLEALNKVGRSAWSSGQRLNSESDDV